MTKKRRNQHLKNCLKKKRKTQLYLQPKFKKKTLMLKMNKNNTKEEIIAIGSAMIFCY